jgi:hypothetical protein
MEHHPRNKNYTRITRSNFCVQPKSTSKGRGNQLTFFLAAADLSGAEPNKSTSKPEQDLSGAELWQVAQAHSSRRSRRPPQAKPRPRLCFGGVGTEGDVEERMSCRGGVRAAHAGAERRQSRADDWHRWAQRAAEESGRHGLVEAGRVVGGDRDSGAAEESGIWGRQKNRGDRGLGGSNGFEATFPETPYGGRVLDNRRRSANLAGQKRALVKRRMKRRLFGWDFAFLRQK